MFQPGLLNIVASTTEEIIVTSGPIGTPLGTADNPFLPTFVGIDEEESNGFTFEIFDFEILPGQTFFIDPDIAVGYTYTIEGSTFTSVTAPTLAQVNDANAQYDLTAVGLDTTIDSGERIEFALGGVSEFTLAGIDVTPGLDPTDPLAFITGISVDSFAGRSITITQTPIIQSTPTPSPVPLPAGLLLLAPALMLLGGVRRRKA